MAQPHQPTTTRRSSTSSTGLDSGRGPAMSTGSDRSAFEQYIEQQLHPERIADESLAARLNGLSTLTLSSKAIAERYEIPQMQARRDAKQEAASSPNPDQAPSVKEHETGEPGPATSQRAAGRALHAEGRARCV